MRWKLLPAIAALAVLSASCVAQPGAMTPPPGVPTASETPTPSPEPPAGSGDCYTAHTGMKDWLTNSVVELSKMADFVAVGTVVAVSETRWATADGKEPVRAEGDNPSTADVYRLATFRLTRVGKVGLLAGRNVAGRQEVIIRVRGGEIGCKKFPIEDQPSFEVGQEIAGFFVIDTQLRGVTLPGDFSVMWPWWIYQGKVRVPLSVTPLTVDEFIAQSLSAPVALPS